jgi:hypothetical protein
MAFYHQSMIIRGLTLLLPTTRVLILLKKSSTGVKEVISVHYKKKLFLLKECIYLYKKMPAPANMI